MTSSNFDAVPTAQADETQLPAPGTALQPSPAPQHQLQVSGQGPVGKIRGTGVVLLLTIVTAGIYGLYYFYATHDEIQRHSGRGIGGGVGLLVAILAGVISSFLLPNEVGQLYENRGQKPPVSALTGLWYTLGAFILVGPLVWLVKTNGALNSYWRSLGAR